MGDKTSVVIAVPQADAQTPSPAEPAVVFLANKRSPADITSSAINDIASFHTIARKSFCIGFGNACYAILNDTIVTDVQRHDGRNPIRNIIAGMKLATERPCLNVAAAFRAKFAK